MPLNSVLLMPSVYSSTASSMFINFGQSHNTYNHPYHIEKEPSRRGTVSLVVTCLLTNVMCIWQAIHLNIPGAGKCRRYRQYGRRTVLFCLGLLAPEVVAYVAWQQMRSAKKLLDKVPLERRKHSWWRINAPKDPCKWSMTHAFYAIMGGFVIKFPGNENEELGLPSTLDNQYTILPDGVLRLLQTSPEFTNLSVEEIDDKIKGDSITKAIVVTQASYFIYQCAVRWHTHLPISILEHNTLAHALCSVLIYIVWWKKPLNIGKPTLLTEPQVRDVLKQAHKELQPKKEVNEDDESDPLAPLTKQLISAYCCQPVERFFVWLTKPDPIGVLAPRATNRPELKPSNPSHIPLKECIINSLFITLTLGVYALLHLFAWDGLFTTSTEKRLWRTSSVILALSGVVYFFQALWSTTREPMTWRLDCRKPGSVVLGFFIFVTLVFCTLARLFLVVESIWNAFHLAPNVYDMPPGSPRFF